MATISETKDGGRECFANLAKESKTLIIVVNIGVNYLGGRDGSKRDFIQHLGAFAPFSRRASKRFFRAISGSRLLKQLQQIQVEKHLSNELKRLNYSILQGSLVYKVYQELYKCHNPQETIRDFLQFVITMKEASKSQKICFFLKDETQVKYFNDFFVNTFSQFTQKLPGVMCTSLDSILKCVKSNYNIENLATLQATEGKKQTLNELLLSKSDLMCVSLFESFFIVLWLDNSNGNNIQILLRQILQAGVEQKIERQEKNKKTNMRETETNEKNKSTEHKFLPDSKNTKQELQECKDEPLLAQIDEEASLTERTEVADSYQLKYDVKLEAEPVENGKNDTDTESLLCVTDHFMSDTSITMFIKTDFLENVKQWRMNVRNSRQPLFLQCMLHPTGKVLLLGFDHSGPKNKKLYKVEGKTVHYIGHPGFTATCYPVKMAFEMLTSFVKETRKQEPTKQFNVFIREFESFNKLMGIPEWRDLLGSLDTLVTLYSQTTGSLVRVPDLPLTQMASYLNNVLSKDNSCILHKEHVSSVFSGLNV